MTDIQRPTSALAMGSDTIEIVWAELEFEVNKLAELIIAGEYIYPCITGLPRGGLVPAVMLSHKLGIPYKSYETLVEEKTFDAPALDSQILIVDDICDTGGALCTALEFLRNSHTATIYKRYNSAITPEYYTHEIKTDHWIVFPWENQTEN